MTLHIGIGLFTAQLPPGGGRTFVEEYADILELARLAEAAGFDSAWVSEHHGSSDGYMPSLLPTLAGIAAVTERIRLGTGVMLTPFHHPLRLAEDAATVDLLSGGRLILGLGLAWRKEEFRMFGVPLPERVRRTTETIHILRRAWTGERFSFEGKAYSYDRVRVTPPPARAGGPPIYLGGVAEAAIRRAGRLADGFIRTRGAGIEGVARDLDLAEEGARRAGKDPSSLGFAQLQNVFVWEDGDAWDVVKTGLEHQLGVYGGWEAGADTPGRGFALSPPPEELLRKRTPVGTGRQVLDALRPLVQALSSRDEFHLIVRLHYPGMDLGAASRAVELFAEQVLPELKSGGTQSAASHRP